MLNCCCSFIFVLLLSVLSLAKTSGQTSVPVDQSPEKNVLEYFQKEIGENAHLYTGKEYTSYSNGIKGFAFFITDQMQSGDIFYDGTLYSNIPLLFDIVRQEVVINRYNQEARIKLLNEKLKYFTFSGHRFENIALSVGKDEALGNDIYDVVFNSKANVFVKRVKRIKNPIKAEDPPIFVEEDVYYIRNGNNLYAVDSRNSLIEAMSDKKDLVKNYIKKNKLRFKKNIENDLITVAAYYSTLN
jgi:hypothetical protein